MINAKERWVFYYDKQLIPRPDGAPPLFKMQDMMELLYSRQQAGESVKLLNNKSAAIRIIDMKLDPDKKVAILLIQYADTNISDPAFSNLETGILRVEPKLEGEGVAVSAHLVISLESSQSNDSSYLALLEDVPGIGKTKIEPFLTSEFKNVSIYSFENEENRVKPCYPVANMDGFMAQTLRDDLAEGSLQHIELVKPSPRGGDLDEPGFAREISRNIQIKPSKPYVGDEALGIINRIKEKAKNKGYLDMRIRFKKPQGKQRSILIGTAREDAGDALYTKCDMIKVLNPLPQCLEKIRDDVSESITQLLINAR